MIIYDGERIAVSVNKNNYQRLLELAKTYDGNYNSVSNYFDFPIKRIVVKELAKEPKGTWDSSFSALVEKCNVVNKESSVNNSLIFPSSAYEFQKEIVSRMYGMSRNIMLCADMGTGKSLMSLMYLNNHKELLPCVIVCPASLKKNWQNEVNKWTEFSSFIVYGKTSFNDNATVFDVKNHDITIINYDILGDNDKDALEREKHRQAEAKALGQRCKKAKIPTVGWVNKLKELGIKSVICDECQYIESTDAIRSRAVAQLCEEPSIKKIFLSGTPYETRTAQLFNAVHILASDLFPDEWKFKFRYCDPKKEFFGWKFDGLSNANELRAKLANFMIRCKMEDVLPQLPKNQRIMVALDIDEKLRKPYEDMENELVGKKDGMDTFSYLAQMRKALVQIKLKPIVQYIKDMLELEDKIVVFVYHVEMYDSLMKEFGGICVGINGSVPTDKRQEPVDRFQNDSNIKLFIGQIKSCGAGITLTSAKVTIFVELGNTVAQHEQAECRIRRIGQTADHVLSYYLLVKDTIDEDGFAPLERHNKDIKAVMDGDDNAEKMFDLDSAMIARVKERVLQRKKKGVRIDYD